MRITAKGQVTIPIEVRERMGFLPHTEVEFCIEQENVVLKKVEKPSGRGAVLVDRMTGKATITMTTDEIVALTRG